MRNRVRVALQTAVLVPLITIGGAIALGIVVIIVVIVIAALAPNAAEEQGKAIGAAIARGGGDPICDDGDGAQGPDNTHPWYEAFHEFDDQAQALRVMTETAADAGFALEPLLDDDGDPYEEPDGGLVLTGESAGNRLEVIISETSMPGMWCASDSERERLPEPGHALTRFVLIYPDDAGAASARQN